MFSPAPPKSVQLDAAEMRMYGRVRGERISRQKGVSLEFADYRDYSDGDDLRHLDWNVLARLERPTIRTYQDEDDLAVYIALDRSASMDFGIPSKAEHAARIALLIGYLGLIGQDALYPVALGNGEPRPARVLRGRGGYLPFCDWLGSQQSDGKSGLAHGLRRFARSAARPGLFALVTDGLDADLPDALRTVAARGHELFVVQTLSDLDLNPDVEGDLRLLDAESDSITEITANLQAIADYRRNLQAHCERIENAVLRGGGRYFRTTTDMPLDEIVTDGLRRLQVAK